MNRKLFIVAFSFIFSLFLFGCDDKQIDSYEDDTGNYSIYGAMNLHDHQNVIRVRDLNLFHSDSNSINLDATVTFFDIENGTSKMLQDSIIEYPENYTHNFILEKDLKPRNPYKVTVERSDGASTSSTFTTPGITVATTLPRKNLLCSTFLEIRFRNVTPSEQVRWEVGFDYNQERYWLELSGRCNEKYVPENNELIIRVSTQELLSIVFPAPGSNAICGKPPFRPEIYCRDLPTNRVYIRYTHLGSEWQKVYPIRPVDPLDIGDIENGLGFLGGYRQDTLSYTVRLE